MQIILLEKVGGLGNLGDILEVKNGYARNYLIPQGKAKRANKQNIAEFEQRKAELEAKQAQVIKEAQEKQAKVDAQVIKIRQKSGIDGRLFGSVTTIDIARAINDFGIVVERSAIRLPDGPLRTTGEYDIEVAFHHDAVAIVKLLVEAEID